ncbi:hypothetical protein chiPu_0029826, partial [Chiloscyllium punctatum]|nr:hypothetical protein [Chiloscyllium punctatum]
MMSHRTVGSRLSLSTETGSIRTVQPSVDPRPRACCKERVGSNPEEPLRG